MASDSDVSGFLRQFQLVIQKKGVIIWQTQKNTDFLLETGFTNHDVEAVLKNLRVRDYSSGPHPDDNPSRPQGDVWRFSREFEGYDMYIKLKLHAGNAVAECMSFHEAEAEMRQPNRTRRR